MSIFRWEHPWVVVLGALVVALLWWWENRRAGQAEGSMRFSDVRNIRRIKPSWRLRLRPVLSWLRLAGVLLIFLALARPQSGLIMEEITSEGVDIMIALDVSGSMGAPDYNPRNRMDVAKLVVEEFVRGRTNDRIGLVVFAGEAYVLCPLTLDYGVLQTYVRDSVQILMGTYREGRQLKGMIQDGTAIGMAVAHSVNRLKDSKAKSRVLILLTDGANNSGEIAPLHAAEIAATLGIKVYTIGVGREQGVPQSIVDPLMGQFFAPAQKSDIDIPTLQEIAAKTGAQFYRATDPKALEKAFESIDALEKTNIEVKEFQRFTELYFWFAGAALLLLAIEMLLSNTILMRIP